MSDADRPGGPIHSIRGGKNGPPPPKGPVRRLASILAADISGYSRLMQLDEEGTHARVTRQRRELIEPNLAEHELWRKVGDDGVMRAAQRGWCRSLPESPEGALRHERE
jgi:hypothetical protein